MSSDIPPTGLFLGIFEGGSDPSVAIVRDGRLIAYAEEERHVRVKHAPGAYPIRALRYCLDAAGATLQDVERVGIARNLPAHADGTMRRFFEGMRREWPVDRRTVAWQADLLRRYDPDRYLAHHEIHWRREFAGDRFPPLDPHPHHFVHAFHAAMHSPFDRSLVLTVDGSGDQFCTCVWIHRGETLTPLLEIPMPHSLGWVYAAFTEYLGFRAYDGEYKVMGLAAYGGPDETLRDTLDRIVDVKAGTPGYRVDPTYLHYGPRSHSDRYTDTLVAALGRPPRRAADPLTNWHMDVAFAVQRKLEEAVGRLVDWGIEQTGIHEVCVGGGVGLNVAMNSRILQQSNVRDLFVQPLCSDAGAAAGAALASCHARTGVRPEPLSSLAVGYAETSDSIEAALREAGVEFHRTEQIAGRVADALASGYVVGWFQGRMEAGPRALGQRSILADPRRVEMRDRVNAVIKFREPWRPFCPAILIEAAPRYFTSPTNAPFMVVAFPANAALARDAPAIVHVDGTARVQLVRCEVLPRFHALISAFAQRTGVPVLLNTSFNVRDEPIVCTIQDALRTFQASGLDVLAAEDYLVLKPHVRF